jgi:predicted metal-binding membrane protein
VTVIRRTIWRHPEWTAACLAVAAWLTLSIQSNTTNSPAHVLNMPSMPGMEMETAAPGEAGNAFTIHFSLSWIAGWIVMVTAMMVPATLPTIRHLALTSLWKRRPWTVALFLAGYLAVWTVFGIGAIGFVAVLRRLADVGAPPIVAASLVAAAAWQLTPWKRQSLIARHLVAPPPPRGRKADRACVNAGIRHALWCVVGCWGVMLAMTLMTDIRLVVVAMLTFLTVVENVLARGTRLALPTAATIVAAAIAVAAG